MRSETKQPSGHSSASAGEHVTTLASDAVGCAQEPLARVLWLADYLHGCDTGQGPIEALREAIQALATDAYAEGRKDERETTASDLIDAWCAGHGRPIPWAAAVEITSIVTKMPEAERLRLLALDDAGSAA